MFPAHTKYTAYEMEIRANFPFYSSSNRYRPSAKSERS